MEAASIRELKRLKAVCISIFATKTLRHQDLIIQSVLLCAMVPSWPFYRLVRIRPLASVILRPDIHSPVWILMSYEHCGIFLVTGAVLLAGAVDDDGTVCFEAQVGAA